jgi:chromosome segregation ATPase
MKAKKTHSLADAQARLERLAADLKATTTRADKAKAVTRDTRKQIKLARQKAKAAKKESRVLKKAVRKLKDACRKARRVVERLTKQTARPKRKVAATPKQTGTRRPARKRRTSSRPVAIPLPPGPAPAPLITPRAEPPQHPLG